MKTGKRDERFMTRLGAAMAVAAALWALSAAPAAAAVSVPLSWDAVTTDAQGNPLASLTGYRVYYATNSLTGMTTGQATLAGSVIKQNTGNVLTYSVANLSNATTYYFRLTAFNPTNESDWSVQTPGPADLELSTCTPPAPQPPAASVLNPLTAVSSTQIDASWSAVANVTGYRLERSLDNVTYSTVTNVGSGVTTYSDNALSPATLYYYRVFAKNAAGDSPASNVQSTQTLPAPPTAPSTLAASAISTTRIDLTWMDNSNNETGFKVEWSLASNFSGSSVILVAAGSTGYSHTGLTPSTSYYYRVRATNSGGDSANSNAVSRMTLTPPPAAPSGLSATPASSAQINLAWTDNSNNETGFKIDQSLDGVTFNQIATVGANVLTYQNTGLTASTNYVYRVRATNAGGDSANSNTANATTLPPSANPPLAPSALTATAVSATQINLSFTDNSDAPDGETGFEIQWSLNSGFTSPQTLLVGANPGTGTVSFSHTGLTGSTAYFYRVRAVNAQGNSAYSSSANATTPVAPPAAPSGLTATAASTTQINLAWTDNSSNETGFKIERSPDGTTFAQIIVVGAGVTSYQNTGLASSTQFFYRVRATNTGGDSAYSNTANATTQTPLPPAIPAWAATVFTSVSSTSLTLNWVNVANETGYRIERSLTSGVGYAQVAQVGVDVTSYTDPGPLTPNTYYYYRIRSYNGAGNSGYSSEQYTRTAVSVGGSGLGGTPPGLRDAYCFPNPARGVDPTIRSMMGGVDSVEVTIFDQSGRTVHSGRTSYPTNVNGEIAFDYTWTGEKAPGVYYAIIHGKKGDETIRARAKFAVVR